MDHNITSDLVEAYSQCRKKAFLILKGEPQDESHVYEIAVSERAAKARLDYLSIRGNGIAQSIADRQHEFGFGENPNLSAGDLLTTCNVVLSGSRQEPYLIVGTVAVTSGQKLQLAFAGYVIGERDADRPKYGTIITFEGTPKRIQLHSQYRAIGPIIDVLREWIKQLPAEPPPLVLNSHCATCPFRQRCLKEAEQQDNLSLLDRMTPKAMQRYHKRGVFTLNQLSYTYRPRRRRKRHASAPAVFKLELQALAIRTGKIYVHELPSIPKQPVELFLDIEGLPAEGVDYLIGLDIREGDHVERHAFWADSPEDEARIFNDCIKVASQYSDAPIFHYGSYEPRAFARIAKKHEIQCDVFVKRFVNVSASVYGKVYFPARSNRLKELGNRVGMTWKIPNATGLHSIAWRWRWVDTRNANDKQLLLTYNADDCRALRLLTSELQNISLNSASRTDVDFANAPKQNTTAIGEGIHRAFTGILTSAYQEYRANRLSIRSSSGQTNVNAIEARPKPKRRAHVPRSLPRCVGKRIFVPRKRVCPRHPTHLLTASDKMAEVPLIDLEFTKRGCRKTVVRYIGKRAYCPLCKFAYLPPAIRRLQGRVFGDHFQAWVVYQHVALRVPYSAIAQATQDMFAEHFRSTTLLHFMGQLSEKYAATEALLLNNILTSPFVHADETKINIKGMNQYVWVLTNGKHVVFRLTETREPTLVQSLLGEYQGVLVSDFYGGYDAVPCRQQKCWVHLIRDLNDDLWENPYNQEYEMFVGAIRDLLAPIFDDIRRFGLRRRHLHKHQRAVERFYTTTIDRLDQEGELFGKYKKRFVRYRPSLFRFLEENDLPWNNNAAERAIRHLAVQRKISGSFSSRGAIEHLRLLGISQSCRFQGKSFLKFLLSDLRDVDELKTKARSR